MHAANEQRSVSQVAGETDGHDLRRGVNGQDKGSGGRLRERLGLDLDRDSPHHAVGWPLDLLHAEDLLHVHSGLDLHRPGQLDAGSQRLVFAQTLV